MTTDNKVYILQKDLPEAKAGTKWIFDGADDTYNYKDSDGQNCWYRKNYVENNPEWFLQEVKPENKSNDSFQLREWREFAEWASHSDWTFLPSRQVWYNEEDEQNITPLTTKDLFEKFKQSHTPKPQAENKPDWEVVRMETGYGLVLHTSTQVAWPEWEVIGLLDRGYKINSVKRKSDGEVFSVGDVIEFNIGDVKNAHIEKFTIDSFDEKEITAWHKYAGRGFKAWEKVYPPQPQKEEQRIEVDVRYDKEPMLSGKMGNVIKIHVPYEYVYEKNFHKTPAIKQAIEQVLNDDKKTIGIKCEWGTSFISKEEYDKEVDAMCEDARKKDYESVLKLYGECLDGYILQGGKNFIDELEKIYQKSKNQNNESREDTIPKDIPNRDDVS